MIPIELELKNFTSYKSPNPLDLRGMHVACLAGTNGSGKSSILESITWALWGKARTNSADDLIHQGEDEMRVSVVFQLEGQDYKVIRQRSSKGKRGSSLLELQTDDFDGGWKSLSGATIKDTQEKINELLRLDYDTFINSAFLVQGKADEFVSKTPNERKQILANILNLQVWDQYEKSAKEQLKEITTQITRLDGQLETINNDLERRGDLEEQFKTATTIAITADKELQNAQAEWDRVAKTRETIDALTRDLEHLNKEAGKLISEIEEHENGRLAIKTVIDNLDNTTERLEEAQTELKELDGIDKEVETIDEQRIVTSAQIVTVQTKSDFLNKSVKIELEQIKVLKEIDSPTCPTCSQDLTEEHREKIIADHYASIADMDKEITEAKTQIGELNNQLNNIDTQRNEIMEKVRTRIVLEKQIIKLQNEIEKAEDAQAQLEKVEAKIQTLTDELDRIEAEDEGIIKQIEAHEKELTGVETTEADLRSLKLQKQKADEQKGAAEQSLKRLDELAETQAKLEAERGTLSADHSDYEILREAFSKKGVPAMIIETVVPELEHSANEILSRMTDGRMAVRFDTQRELKSGEMREALDIIISDELGTRPYGLYSGGESFRINFAIRVALSRLLARRAGAELRSLFIDEGFGSQDAQGREQLVSAIQSIQNDFDLILVITHIEELKDMFPQRIEVQKNHNGSTFRIT